MSNSKNSVTPINTREQKAKKSPKKSLPSMKVDITIPTMHFTPDDIRDVQKPANLIYQRCRTTSPNRHSPLFSPVEDKFNPRSWTYLMREEKKETNEEKCIVNQMLSMNAFEVPVEGRKEISLTPLPDAREIVNRYLRAKESKSKRMAQVRSKVIAAVNAAGVMGRKQERETAKFLALPLEEKYNVRMNERLRSKKLLHIMCSDPSSPILSIASTTNSPTKGPNFTSSSATFVKEPRASIISFSQEPDPTPKPMERKRTRMHIFQEKVIEKIPDPELGCEAWVANSFLQEAYNIFFRADEMHFNLVHITEITMFSEFYNFPLPSRHEELLKFCASHSGALTFGDYLLMMVPHLEVPNLCVQFREITRECNDSSSESALSSFSLPTNPNDEILGAKYLNQVYESIPHWTEKFKTPPRALQRIHDRYLKARENIYGDDFNGVNLKQFRKACRGYMSPEDIDHVFYEADKNKDDVLNFQEFTELMWIGFV